MLKWLRPTIATRALFFIFGDIFLSFVSISISYLLRFNFSIPDSFLPNFYKIFLFLTFLKVTFYFAYKLYFTSWRFFSLFELKRLIYATSMAYVLFFAIYFFNKDFFMPFPRSAILIDFFLSLIFIGFFRISKRIFVEQLNTQKEPAIIIGANQKTATLLKQDIPYTIVKIFDDGGAVGSYLHGFKILSIDDMSVKVKKAIITKELSQKKLDELFELLRSMGFDEIKIYDPFKSKIKDISIEDLLARYPQDLDKKLIENFLRDKIVLVTGAGGSIGSEICRQCIKYGVKYLMLVDNGEYNLYSIGEELNSSKIKLYLINVANKDSLESVLSARKPDIIIHAAAYKHVPLVEENIKGGIENNIIGTKNCIDLAIKYGVKKFILISTDKAVRPTNVMGATKRVCELYAGNVESKDTEVVTVRFGNVLGSSGSVIPKFKKQIEQGGPVTVTHPDITRYFMLIPEACELVLQTGAIAKGGEIFILDMGEPIKIVNLAKNMIDISGKKNIDIEFTGLRPGEKLHEELFTQESKQQTVYSSITVAKNVNYDIKKLCDDINELLICEDKIEKLQEIVPEFDHKA